MDKNVQCELLASTHTYMHTLTHMHTHVQTHNTHTRIYNVKIQSVEQIGSGGISKKVRVEVQLWRLRLWLEVFSALTGPPALSTE